MVRLDAVRSAVAICLFLIAFGYVTEAPAQARACLPRENMTDRLKKTFQETPRAFGLVGSRAIVELYVSGLGGWTIIVTGTDGIACVLAAGEGWENIPLTIGEEL